MLGGYSITPGQESKCIFLMGPGSKYGATISINAGSDRIGCVATCTAQYHLLSSEYLHDRIVVTGIYIPIMSKIIVTNTAKPFKSFIVFSSYGFLCYIAACHDKRNTGMLKENVVNRRIGKHYPFSFIIQGNQIGERVITSFFSEKYYRSSWGSKDGGF